MDAILEYVNDRLHPTMIKQLNEWRSTIEEGQKTCDFLRNVCQDYFNSIMNLNMEEQWLTLIYLTKIKDEKLLNEVLKDIKEIRRADTIIDMVQNLEMSKDNTKKILSTTTDAKAFYAYERIKMKDDSADEIKCYMCHSNLIQKMIMRMMREMTQLRMMMSYWELV